MSQNFPHVYVYSMMSICIFGTLIDILGLCCVVRRSPASMTSQYKSLTINYLAQSLWLHVYLIGGVTPIFLFPCIAGYSGGLFGLAGIPITWQYIGTMWFMAAYGGSMAAPFYYRCDIILPQNHIFNHRPVRWFAYSLMLLYPSVITPPVWIISIATTNSEAVKGDMAPLCPNETDQLYSEGTLAFDFFSKENPFQIFTFVILLLALATCIVSISLFCSLIFHFLNQKRGLMSRKTRQMHRSYVVTLCCQVSIAQVFFLIPIAVACLLGVIGSSHTVVIHICMFCLGISSPAGTITMIISSPSYRQFGYEQLRLLILISTCGSVKLKKELRESFKPSTVSISVTTRSVVPVQ